VFGTPGDQDAVGLTADGRSISVRALAAVIGQFAPGLKPVLWMPRGGALAGPLAEELGTAVAAAEHGIAFAPATGVLRATAATENGPDESFRLYGPNVPDGTPAFATLSGSPWPPDLNADGSSGGNADGGRGAVRDDGADHRPDPVVEPGLGETLDVDPLVRSIGVPKAGLPDLPQLIAGLRQQVAAAGHHVPDHVWELLPQRLLSNYRYLLGGEEELARGGLVVPLGPVEALLTLDPRQPRKVTAPSAPADHASDLPVSEGSVPDAVGTINASYQTGAHVQSHSGGTGATRAGVGLSYGIGLAPGVLQVVRAGVGLSGVANQSSRATRRVADAEGGHVEDSRSPSTLLAYTPNWSFRIRTRADQEWAGLEPHRLASADASRLLLWVPDHYLGQAPQDQTVLADADRHRLPDTYYVSGLGNLPALYDAVLGALRGQGLTPAVGSLLMDELLQKLWNLDAHLDEAVNDHHGYHFTLHDFGRPVATVEIHSARQWLDDATETVRVGETSDLAHIENVRTAIDGMGGSHTLGHSTALSGNLGVDLLPAGVPGVALGVSAGLSHTWSNSDTSSAGRTGLWVVVPRYSGFTSAYHVAFSHSAKVAVRGRDDVARTDAVTGRALLRLPEPAAFAHGFPVDRAALKNDPGSGNRADAAAEVGTEAAAAVPGSLDAARIVAVLTGASTTPDPAAPRTENSTTGGRWRTTEVELGADALRNTGRRPGDPESKPVPVPMSDGRGIGMGLPEIGQATVDAVYAAVRREVERYHFLPPEGNPFRGHGPLAHGNDLDSRIDNEELLRKLVSRRGFESSWDELHQDGMTFTLRRRRGFAGIDFDVDSARVTITARPSTGQPTRYVRSTDEYHTVNLAMGMDTVGHAVGGGRRIALGIRARLAFGRLRGALTGFEVHRSVGATNAVGFLNNRPELLEFPGTADEFALRSDFTVVIEFQHSGLQGQIRRGVRDPEPITVRDQRALARVMPLTGGVSDPSAAPTPPQVLDNAVVYHLDSTGARTAVADALSDLIGPSAMADPELSSFTSNIMMRAHAKEIVNGEYTTDQFFDPGLIRDTHGAVDISGTLGTSRFIGASESKFVLGNIKLWLAQTFHTDTSSEGVSWNQLDLGVGDAVGPAVETGGLALGRSWRWNKSATDGRTGGKELIQLDFHRVYAYSAPVSFTVSSRQEKHAKLLPSTHREDRRTLDHRGMLYLLSEPEALERYADGTLPVTDTQLADALHRWEQGELVLSGNVIAGALTRWTSDRPQGVDADRAASARLLTELHAAGASPVLDPVVRDAFHAAFPDQRLADPEERIRQVGLPEYLTREDQGGRFLGHSGFTSLRFDSGKSVYRTVKEQVERVAPGLLAAGAEAWTADGRVIGRMQGSVDALQGLLAQGRDQAMWEDLLSANGHSFYLVNPIGWLLADVVEINLAGVLHAPGPIHDLKPETGLENYGHGYVGTSVGRSRDGSQSVTAGKLSSGGGHGSGSSGLSLSEGRHRGTNRAENAVSEQTVYDWGGHYTLTMRHSLTVGVRRISMGGRPLNDALATWHRGRKGQAVPVTVTETGTMDLQVPRSVAEAAPLYGPATLRSPVPLPDLPGDSVVVGVVMDDLLPAGRRLLANTFGRKADKDVIRASASLETLLSRSQLANHLAKATGGRSYKIADNVFMPGHSSDRATLWLNGELYDLDVIAPVEGSGTGRYSKHQSGTTAFNNTDHWRPTASVSASGFGGVPSHQSSSLSGDLGSSRTTSADQGSAGTRNYRREQHVKQQGPMYLVRMRGRFALKAQRTRHHLFRKPSNLGQYHSDPVTGDVYAVLYQDVVDGLRARLDEAHEQAATVQ
ncbi:hypothetical protein AB0D38_29650, partial [Streptomyces sp. NPDC048279]|uniref:hypothetical protein n=1 Tax=Streptomyces sp. NPDC048279 TaxID=3154714 RepID=UPI0034472BBA